MLFVIPEMPSKTFIMVLKKLPDHFNPVTAVPKTPKSWKDNLKQFTKVKFFWKMVENFPGNKINNN